MNPSMNEIEATARKAARGAGYTWGLAEEAGKATRWLCSNGVDGCGALAGLLGRIDGKDLAVWSPQIKGEIWSAQGGTLCPLVTGAALSDRAHEIGARGVVLDAVEAPIILAPFAALLAAEFKRPVEIHVGDMVLCTDGTFLSFEGTPPRVASGAQICVGGTVNAPNKTCQRAVVDPKDWATLSAFAHRTYAPATEESRLKGAGTGLSDSD